jgi:flagellar biosynthetic protein FliR
VAFGLLLGFVCRLILFAVALAGHYIGGQLGLQLSSLIAPGESTPSQTPAVMLQMITVMLMFSLDIHFELLMGFQQTYNVLAIGGGHLSNALFTEITGLCARTFVVALRIAAPLIAVGIVVNLLMMVLGRTIPEVNVFILSFSIRILVGVFLFGFTLSLAAREITNYLRHLPDDFVVVTRLLAGG